MSCKMCYTNSNPTRWKKLSTWWPDCIHDINCHNSNWPRGMGLTLNELKIVWVCAGSFQLCPTLCNPMDCSLPGSSVHGILQTGILEWVAISSSRRSSWPRDWTCASCIVRQFLYNWATWEAQSGGYWYNELKPWAYVSFLFQLLPSFRASAST